jgi:hypothetical protein
VFFIDFEVFFEENEDVADVVVHGSVVLLCKLFVVI